MESIDFLNGKASKDLKDLIYELSYIALNLKTEISKEEAFKIIDSKISNGDALKKFNQFIKYQNGDVNEIAISNKVISF